MLVNRFADAEKYEAPNHWDVTGLRLQGFADGGPENQWVGLSQFLPGGAGPDSTPFEKVYVVLEGEMTVTIDGEDTVRLAVEQVAERSCRAQASAPLTQEHAHDVREAVGHRQVGCAELGKQKSDPIANNTQRNQRC